MKEIKFLVTLTFADSLTNENEINEVANNIANALKYEADTHGLAPEASETYTEKIEVSPLKLA